MTGEPWPILAGLSEDEGRRLVEGGRTRRLRAGEVLFARGDAATSMFLVEAGQLVVRVEITGREQGAIVAVLGPGDAFGESALAEETATRGGLVEAVAPSELLEIDQGHLATLRADGVDVDRLLLRLLLNRSASLTEQLVESLVVPLQERIASRLLRLVESCDVAPGDRLPLGCEELVSMTGADYGTVKLCLGDLVRRHAVRLRGDEIRLYELDALRVAAGLEAGPTDDR